MDRCAARDRGALPTLKEYSDGTNLYVDALLRQWKSASLPAELFAADLRWSGPLPGEGTTPVLARLPLSVAIYQAPATTAGATAEGPGRDALVARLEGLRQRFS
jgi:hypothetical protein